MCSLWMGILFTCNCYGCLWFIVVFLRNYEISTCRFGWPSYWHSMCPLRRFFNLILDTDKCMLLLFVLFCNIITATSNVTLIVWFFNSCPYLFVFANESHKTNSENLEVVKNVQDHEYFKYFIIMLLVYVKWGSLGLHFFMSS